MASTRPTTDRATILATIQALTEGGYVLREVHDGQEIVPVTTATEAVDAITAVDLAKLVVGRETWTRDGWVLFVMGNGDPLDCVADFTLTLAPVLEPLLKSWW